MNITSDKKTKQKHTLSNFLCNAFTPQYWYSGIGIQIDSPKKATGWRVRVAVKCRVLRSQQEGENSSSACTERMPDYHQPIMHGALVLCETARVITFTRAHLLPQRRQSLKEIASVAVCQINCCIHYSQYYGNVTQPVWPWLKYYSDANKNTLYKFL